MEERGKGGLYVQDKALGFLCNLTPRKIWGKRGEGEGGGKGGGGGVGRGS